MYFGKQISDEQKSCQSCDSLASSSSNSSEENLNLFEYDNLIPAPKNSLEVVEKVRELQSEIDTLIEVEYIKEVESWLYNIEEYINDYVESIKSYENLKVKAPKHLYEELGEMKEAAKLKGKKREQYIIDKARMNLRMLGSCHCIWNTQKKILKEVYNIDWLTPAEEHPEIMFD